MLTDLKHTIRQLAKSPGFALTAIITLALGIGANAVVFSVLNAVVLRPVNLPDADNLFMVQRAFERGSTPSQSYPDYVDLRDKNHTFSIIMAFNIVGPVGVDAGGNPSTAWPYMASGNYFDGLGVQPYLGRFYHAADEKGYDSAPYVVLSYAFWHSYFHGDSNVVGKTLQINKHPMTVIGVAPKSFRGTELFFAPAMWIPIVEMPMEQGANNLQYRGNHSSMLVGRLKPGVAPQAATADLNILASALSKAYPGDDDGLKLSLAHPGLMGDMLGGPAKAFMGGLMLLAGLILLAACANLGSLFAARASDRAKQVALRLALGSPRGLILRQLLTEAVLVSIAGGIAGMVGGIVVLRGLSAWQPMPLIPINVPVNPDFRTYTVALLLALASGLLFGMVPVRQVLRADPWQIIRTGMSSDALKRFSLRDVLLVTQIAICAVLVTSSLVAVRGLMRSLHSNFGFEPQNAMIVETAVSMAGYKGDNVPILQKRMIDALAVIPGVQSVGLIDRLPLYYGANSAIVFTDKTTDLRLANAAAEAAMYNVSPEYLGTARTTLLAGRGFTWHDDKSSPRVAVVNREFASKILGSVTNGTGQYYKLADGSRVQVVGIVEDGKYASLAEAPQPAMFFPILQSPSGQAGLVVRSNRDAQQLTAAIKSTMHDVDAGLPFEIKTWNQELDAALLAPRLATISLGVLGVMGAMLSITGIFGMAAHTVSKRLKELGIRMALGARPTEVLQAALGRAFRLLAFGSAAGLFLGVLASRVLAFIVYQATPRDPIVLGGVVFAMAMLGLVAAWIPAQRALSVSPLVLLRDE